MGVWGIPQAQNALWVEG